MSRERQRSRGQALAEFALVAPWFFLTMFGVIEVGRFIYYNEVLNDAAREGARYAIVHGSEALCPSGPMPGGATNTCDPSGQKVADAVTTFAIGVIRDGTYQIGRCWFPPSYTAPATCPAPPNQLGNGDNNRGSYVLVTLDYQYRPLLPFVPLPQIGIHTESTLVVNH